MNKKKLSTEATIPSWTFLSNHAHVLLCLAGDPEIRLREIAVAVGITERAVNRIISELEEAEYISKDKVGRRNQYRIVTDKPLRHPLEAHSTIKILLDIVKVKKKRGLSR